MNTLLLGLRVLLFALSTFGYLTFLHQKVKLATEFLLPIVFTGQICVLFLAGILNLLLPITLLLFLLGLIFFIFSFKKRSYYRDFLCPGYIFFLVASLYFLFLMKGQVFNSYDNFSHWALVIKQMLKTDRFPTFQDSIILFQSYPLGSASFVYYVSRIISPISEGCQMFAQTILTLSMILPIFSNIKRQKISGLLLMLGTTLFFLSYNTVPSELLVDTLLPLTGAFSLLLLEQELQKAAPSTWLTVIPAAALILIKNSGIFFWAILAVRLFIYYFKNRHFATTKQKLSWSALLFVPLFILLLWNKHVNYVFAAAESSPHTMSLSSYMANIQAKTTDSIPTITKAFLQKLLSGRAFLILLGVLIILTIVSYVVALHLQKHHNSDTLSIFYVSKFRHSTIFITLVFIFYQLGNLCMYLFSMPEGEAVVMAGYERYYKTIILFCFAYTLYYITEWLDQQKFLLSFAFTILFIAVFGRLGARFSILQREPTNPVRAKIENFMDEYSIEHYQEYLLLLPEDDSGYAYHLTKYLLYTPTVDFHVITDTEQLAQVVETAIEIGYDYLINLDAENPIISEYCQDVLHADAGQDVIRLQPSEAVDE